MSKGIIYYTDLRVGEPIAPLVRQFIHASGLPIISCSLNKPLGFGENHVLEGERGWATMARQIIVALENSRADDVFFCEHDVLYHSSHFEFTPSRNDTFYYNVNTWRWRYPKDWAITYDHLISLSGLCCNRELALNHFKGRIKTAEERGYDFDSREPYWARKWGYEPGTKRRGRGGFSDEKMEVWRSEFPNIDIRHKKTLSLPKVTLKEFKHIPQGWKEIKIKDILGWNLKGLFEL